MKGMKYIVVDDNGLEAAIIFPPWMKHDIVANLQCVANKVVSAGFVSRNYMTGDLQCGGESVSLKKKSRPTQDLDLILQLLTFEGC